MTEWQPIETAPKHGAGKGLFGHERGPELMLTDGESIYIGFWNGRSWDDGDFYDDIGGVTHWMPLPALPDEVLPPPTMDSLRRKIEAQQQRIAEAQAAAKGSR